MDSVSEASFKARRDGSRERCTVELDILDSVRNLLLQKEYIWRALRYIYVASGYVGFDVMCNELR